MHMICLVLRPSTFPTCCCCCSALLPSIIKGNLATSPLPTKPIPSGPHQRICAALRSAPAFFSIHGAAGIAPRPRRPAPPHPPPPRFHGAVPGGGAQPHRRTPRVRTSRRRLPARALANLPPTYRVRPIRR